MSITLQVHDDALPRGDAGVVDQGLGDFNETNAPLSEVRALGCFARDETGTVVGGAVGRSWGDACELQQLWVDEKRRGGGLGSQLMHAFEQRARERGCRHFYLETFSFQAPDFYRRFGYEVVHTNAAFPHGIAKFVMERREP